MFVGDKLTPQDILRQAKEDYHPDHPRLRMSFLSYAMSNGITPDKYDSAGDYVGALGAIYEWMVDGYEAYIAALEADLPEDGDGFDGDGFPGVDDVDDPFAPGGYM